MKNKAAANYAFLNPRFLIALAFCSLGLVIALLAFALYPGGRALAQGSDQNQVNNPALTQDNSSVTDAPAVLGTCDTAGPIEVEATVGTLGPTAYPTLQGAFAAITAGTHQGTINVEVCGNTTETATASLDASGTGAASYASVTVRPVGATR